MSVPLRIEIAGVEYFGSYYIDQFGAIKFMGFPVDMEEENNG